MHLVWCANVDKHTARLSQTVYRVDVENIALRNILKGKRNGKNKCEVLNLGQGCQIHSLPAQSSKVFFIRFLFFCV